MQYRIKVQDLTMGMYVAKLDRPWLESPFLFQGFYIDSKELLQKVAATCEYVYVDEEESVVPVRNLAAGKKSAVVSDLTQSAKRTDLSNANINDVENFVKFKQVVADSRQISVKTKSYISSILEDVRLGKAIEIKSAGVIVNTIVDKIIENPHAMILFTNLRNKNEYTANHSLNVCVISLAFGNSCGLKRDQLSLLGYGALFHDIGKMLVPLEILDKPSHLTEGEYNEVKLHPRYGYELLKDHNEFPADALEIVLSHHERNDGTGYPRGLKAGQINFLTKLVSVVDMYDAITTSRVYHKPLTPHEALSQMFHWVPNRFDQKIVEQFIKCLGIYPVGSLVELNTGEIGMVVSINDDHHLRPVILLLMNKNREFYNIRKLVNLSNPEFLQLNNTIEIVHVLNPELEKIDISKIIIDESFSRVA